ncbi:MAG: hypothetical protein JW863_01505 [Chitinispirillaceae bacterium]|nr:hypothetical protein [Chitinispirillaceae bacterium]
MRTQFINFFLFFFLITGNSRGLNIEPDSIAKGVTPWSDYHLPLDTVTVDNPGDETVIVDSITIRLLDGDSIDFIACRDCVPGEYAEYLYGGWSYGQSDTSLRYMSDSLFLLQDGDGRPVTFAVPADGSTEFILYLFVNCPVCGRMPSIPAAVNYRYMFHLSTGQTDTLRLTIHNSTVVHSPPGSFMANKNRAGQMINHTITGRKLNRGDNRYRGIVIGDDGKRLMIETSRGSVKKH